MADYLAIEAQLVSVVNEYMYNIQENLKEKEFELDNEIYNKEVIYFTNSQQLSITSYGRDVVSTISLLIDHSLTSNNPDYRKFADGILSIRFCNHAIRYSHYYSVFIIYCKLLLDHMQLRIR